MPWWLWIVVGVIGLLAGGYCFLLILSWQDAQARKRLKRDGVPVIAALVQADDRVFDPDDWWPAPPGQFIITFDEAVKEPKVFLPLLGARMLNLKGKQASNPDERFVADLVTDERFYPNRRVRLPAQFTGGPEVFVVYLSIWKGHLPGNALTEPWIDCMATPGEQGEIAMTATLEP